jgi:hypothetical protein
MLGNFERLGTDRGTNGLYGYEDDDFVVGDDVPDELEPDAGGFFVHNPDQALSAHPVAFLPLASPPSTARVATVAAGAVAHAASTVAPSAAAAVAAAAANVSPQFVSVPPLFEALAAFAAHWTDICAHRGDKGAPARIPNSLYPFGFDVAYQAKLAHPRRQITSDIVDEIKRLLPLEPDSIRAFLKRAFKAGVSAKSGMMATEAAALEAQILRGSGAAMPRAAITSSTNGGVVTAPPPLHNAVAAAAAAAAISAAASAPSSAAPQPTVAEIKNAATYKKALNARQEAAAEMLATFRKTLDNDIATGKIAEPLPAGSGESDKRRQTVWRPQLKSLLSDCVEAALAVSELTFARSQFVDAGTVVQIDDKARERLRGEARDTVLRKVVEFWPEGWITLQKVRQAYSNYKRSQAPAAAAAAAAVAAAATGGADQSQSGATQVATPSGAAAAAVTVQTSPWKARKRFVCVYSGCSEAFNSMDPLKNHVIAAHHGGDATATLELPQHGVKLVGEFKCEVANCYETFFALRDLKMHMTKMHVGVPLPQSPAPTAAVKRSAPDSVVAAATAAESERPIKQRRKKVSSPHEPAAATAAAATAVVEASNDNNDDDNDGAATATNGVEDAEFVCALCSKPAMYECTGCLSVHYCSAECQKSSWKSHMDACKLLAKAKETSNNNNGAVEQ